MFPDCHWRSESTENYLIHAECCLFTINRRLSKQFKEVVHKHWNVAIVAKQPTDLSDFRLDITTHKMFVVIPRPIHFWQVWWPNSGRRLTYTSTVCNATLYKSGPDLQNILQQSYHYLKIHSQNCKIVWDSVCKLAYNIHEKILARFKSLLSVDLTTNLR